MDTPVWTALREVDHPVIPANAGISYDTLVEPVEPHRWSSHPPPPSLSAVDHPVIPANAGISYDTLVEPVEHTVGRAILRHLHFSAVDHPVIPANAGISYDTLVEPVEPHRWPSHPPPPPLLRGRPPRHPGERRDLVRHAG